MSVVISLYIITFFLIDKRQIRKDDNAKGTADILMLSAYNQCKELSKKIKEEIDTKSSFADWLNNQNVRNELQLSIKICLAKNGYPPKYDNEVFNKVMEQVENFSEHSLRNNKILKEKKEVREVAEDKLKYSEDIVD